MGESPESPAACRSNPEIFWVYEIRSSREKDDDDKEKNDPFSAPIWTQNLFGV